MKLEDIEKEFFEAITEFDQSEWCGQYAEELLAVAKAAKHLYESGIDLPYASYSEARDSLREVLENLEKDDV